MVEIRAGIDAKTMNIEKIRGSNQQAESLRAAGLKCIRSAAESRLSASAKWKRRLQQLSRNSTDRYPVPSGGPRPIV